ncbi:glycosyltransferase family 4 protein [Proteiniphilum sp. UBA5510]|jgi:glycosyltransferase involved in cell wall biosynthesis|uniref:glycosyltransferase family 4 protein n=1 Tax=Proteiniphilum sp. UBA5510 TaxID=1947286 RepID=UPI00257D77E7|nr:glycosyltransferase family 4 protein [Proteiniphilum sp. UBA5510]
MRILWITVDVFELFFPKVKGRTTKGRFWIAPLFYSIYHQENVKLGAVIPIVDGKEQKQEIENVAYYSVNIGKKEVMTNMNKGLIDKYINAINDFNPDIIHVHGTEINFGLLRKYVDERIPIVCSIQAIVSPWLSFMKQSMADASVKRSKSLKIIFGRGGVDGVLKKWEKYPLIEEEIFRINKYFIGRTLWDKAYVYIHNPNALYYHGEELLRFPFYNTHWDIRFCEKHRIFVSSSVYPLNGFHTLIKAADILKNKYPDIKLVAPFSLIRENSSRCVDLFISKDYDIFLKREIVSHGLERNVVLLKNLSSEEMANEYKKAHLFALPSFLENSPYSLGEAMMVGTPSVVSSVGGVTSIVKDETSALYFAPGDFVMMAYQIDRLFSDDMLALKISENARIIAEKRHNVEDIIDQYMSIYTDIISNHNHNHIFYV